MNAQSRAQIEAQRKLISLLTETEQRILHKTRDRLEHEAGISAAHAETYLRNLTAVQREVLDKIVRLARREGVARPSDLAAFAHYGILG